MGFRYTKCVLVQDHYGTQLQSPTHVDYNACGDPGAGMGIAWHGGLSYGGRGTVTAGDEDRVMGRSDGAKGTNILVVDPGVSVIGSG